MAASSTAAAFGRPGKSRLLTAFDLYRGDNAFRFLLNFAVLGWMTLICLDLSGGLAPGAALFQGLPIPGIAMSGPVPAAPAIPGPVPVQLAAASAPASAAAATPGVSLAQVLDTAHAAAPAQPRFAELRAPGAAAFSDAPGPARAILVAAAAAYNSGATPATLATRLSGLPASAPAVAYMQGLVAVASASPTQVETGMVLLSRAAGEGMPAAMTAYGLARLSPPAALPADTAQGRQWLQRGADAGDAQAAALLARAYLGGGAGFVDRGKAEELLRRAARLGDGAAGMQLAALRAADGGPAGLAESEQLLRMTADKGDRAAQAVLGRWLALNAAPRGAGFDEAVLWLRRAAAQGDAGAMETLGDVHLYLAKSAPTQDPAEGFAWYGRCAATGRAACHYALGRAYRLALGTGADLPQAFAHLTAARDRGDPRAAAELQLTEQAMSPPDRARGVAALQGLAGR